MRTITLIPETFRINNLMKNIRIKRRPKIRDIKLAVYDYFELDEYMADSKYRNMELVNARQIVHAICYKYREQFNWSCRMIGEETGGKDHASVYHSTKVVKCHCELEKDYRDRYERIERIIKCRFNLGQ